MEIVDLNIGIKSPVAIALGFFDCIHKGHEKLVSVARECAKHRENGCEYSAILTFVNDPNQMFGKIKQIYSFSDRTIALKNLGIDYIVGAKFDTDFVELAPCAFLDLLTDNLNVREIIVGEDYTFGYRAEGNVKLLSRYCADKGIALKIVPFETFNGNKLSTRNLKSLISEGDVRTLNTLLSEPYFMTGSVAHARRKGTQIGFPTANLQPDPDRLPLKDGIYATKIWIDEEAYEGMTNVGAKPTFGVNSTSIETYIFDFDEDVYGNRVKLQFFDRTRDVQKFCSADELRLQLQKDEKKIRQLFLNSHFGNDSCNDITEKN